MKDAIIFVALFYTVSLFLMWIAKEDNVARVKQGKPLDKITNAYPWIIWVLTTILTSLLYNALR